MHALTVRQPWAALIATGRKRVENRTWRTEYRGPLLIHAGASRHELGGQGSKAALQDPPEQSFGAIVALVDLVEIVHLPTLQAELARSEDAPEFGWVAFHEFATGPFCWIFAPDPVLLTPTLARGKQGLWQFDGEVGVAIKQEGRGRG